jgi:thiosulfate dehydrogenase [quinone] large subunit
VHTPEDERRRQRAGSGSAPGLALLPLRTFLGITFVYAGVQKLSDPGFFHSGSSTYIGTQLRGFAAGTPGGFVLRALAIPHPTLAGVGVAVFEILVGLFVVAGLMTRWAAAGGLALNFLLFLTASWHTSPYFLGPDLVFAFAWLPFVLAGATGQPAVEHVLDRRAERKARAQSPAESGDPVSTRRALLGQAIAATASGALAVAGLSWILRGRYEPRTALSLSNGSAKGTAKNVSHRASLPADSVRLGPASALPRGKAAVYRDPTDGSPDIVIRQRDGSLTALSAACTHAGCQVDYQSGVLYCPCHGSVFNAKTGAVEQGPAVTPLPHKEVVQRKGVIYAVPA